MLNANLNDESLYVLSVLRFGLKNDIFGGKNVHLVCYERNAEKVFAVWD